MQPAGRRGPGEGEDLAVADPGVPAGVDGGDDDAVVADVLDPAGQVVVQAGHGDAGRAC